MPSNHAGRSVMSGKSSQVSSSRNVKFFVDESHNHHIAVSDLFMQAPSAIGVLVGKALRWEFVNSELVRVTGRNRPDEFIGKTIRESLPELERLGFFELLENVYSSGEPYVGREVKAVLNKNGRIENAYFNFVYQAFRSDDGQVQGVLVHGIDVTYEVLARKEISRRDRALGLLAAIVDSSDDAIVSKNLDGIIMTWNAAAERMFGYTAEEVIGRSITIIIPQERLNEETRTLALIRRGEAIEHFRTIRRRKDRTLIPISLTVSPIKNAAGQIIGASKIARDISDQVQAETERAALFAREQAAREDAETANRSKDEFLAMLGHELRNPLGAISNAVQVLERLSRPGDATAGARGILARQTRHLSRLMDDLLDIGRVMSSKISDMVEQHGVRHR